MDWRQAIIDHPSLAFLTVIPLFLLMAAIKVGITLSTGGGSSATPDADEDDPG